MEKERKRVSEKGHNEMLNQTKRQRENSPATRRARIAMVFMADGCLEDEVESSMLLLLHTKHTERQRCVSLNCARFIYRFETLINRRRNN